LRAVFKKRRQDCFGNRALISMQRLEYFAH
jgi:hypothetical protein